MHASETNFLIKFSIYVEALRETSNEIICCCPKHWITNNNSASRNCSSITINMLHRSGSSVNKFSSFWFSLAHCLFLFSRFICSKAQRETFSLVLFVKLGREFRKLFTFGFFFLVLIIHSLLL